MGLVERLPKEKLTSLIEECIDNEYDFLILDFNNLSNKSVSDKVKNITLDKEKTYIVLKGIDKNQLKASDFLDIYTNIFHQRVCLYVL